MKWILASFLFIGTSANASQWEIVGMNGDPTTTMVSVDKESIAPRTGYRQAWVRYSYNPSIFNSKKTRKIGSSLGLELVDCKTLESVTAKVVEYENTDGSGEAETVKDLNKDVAMRGTSDPIPGTLGHTVNKFICSTQIR